jgi:hypothetical protein
MKQLNIFELQNSINKKKEHRTNIYETVGKMSYENQNSCEQGEV